MNLFFRLQKGIATYNVWEIKLLGKKEKNKNLERVLDFSSTAAIVYYKIPPKKYTRIVPVFFKKAKNIHIYLVV